MGRKGRNEAAVEIGGRQQSSCRFGPWLLPPSRTVLGLKKTRHGSKFMRGGETGISPGLITQENVGSKPTPATRNFESLMPYSTQADISPAKLSTDQLKQLTSEDGQSIVSAVIDQVIAEADADIDSYAGRKYVVPFNPVMAKVKQLSVAIACYKLFEKRGQLFAGEIPKVYRDMYEDAMMFLKDIALGKAVIAGAVIATTNPNTPGGSFNSNDRVFTNDELKSL